MQIALRKKSIEYISRSNVWSNAVPIEACSHNAVKRNKVTRWFKRFKEGRRSMADYAQTGCFSTITDNTSIEIVSPLLDEDKRMTVW